MELAYLCFKSMLRACLEYLTNMSGGLHANFLFPFSIQAERGFLPDSALDAAKTVANMGDYSPVHA